jgi:hypothetical protein
MGKFPDWMAALSTPMKYEVGKHMARNDVSSDGSYSIKPTVRAHNVLVAGKECVE